jgi:hypothetical protein
MPAPTPEHAATPTDTPSPPPAPRRSGAAWCAGAAVLASALATLAAVARPAVFVPAGLAFAVFAAPGVLAARAALGRDGGWLTPLTLGPIVGFGFSSVALLALWWGGARGLWLLAAAPLLAATFAWPARALSGRLAIVRLGRRDLLPLLLLLLVVPLVVARPFSRVGAPVPDGKAYRAYFTADYVWRMAVVAEVAKGDVPPKNPFYRGDVLHYYWLPHLLTSVEYRHAARRAALDELLLCQSVFMDFAFAAFLFAFVRQFAASGSAAALGAAGAVLFTSFEGLWELFRVTAKGASIGFVRYLNIDAAVRWEFDGMPIDGLQRLLLYQPHHAAGYALGFSGVLVGTKRREARDGRALAAAGVLLGASFLTSTFGALMLATALAVYELVGCLRHRDLRRLLLHALAAAGPLVAAVTVALRLGYTDLTGGPLVTIGKSPAAFVRPIEAIFLSFGPMLLAAAAGAWVAVRRRLGALLPVGAVVVTAFAYYFFVDVRDHQNVYVGWRSGHLLFVAFAALAAVAIDRLRALSPARRSLGAVALGGLALAAAPTTVIDLYNTQDISNRAQGPGFPWTLVLTPHEQEVLGWLRRHTPADAIVQVDPIPRDPSTWAYIPAFAERRMAAGIPISMIPRQKYLDRSAAIHRQLFGARDAREAHAFAVSQGIDYILVGPPERSANVDCEQRFGAAPGLFTLMFRNREVSLFRVNRDRR